MTFGFLHVNHPFFLLLFCCAQMGYPCPDDMELSPAATKAGVREFLAECRCPPKSAQSTYDGRCHELFKTGPCQLGQYFAADTRSHTESE